MSFATLSWPARWIRRFPAAPTSVVTVKHRAENCLRGERLAVAYGARSLFSDLSVELQAGRITALLGPNGAGKSTLLQVLSGQLAPDHGRVRLNACELDAVGTDTLARWRAVMPQENTVAFDFTAEEVVAMGRYPHRYQPAPDEAQLPQEAMAATDVAAYATRTLSTLSGGEKARVQLARALAQVWHAPDEHSRWLLLDEPTAAMDLAHQHRTFARLATWAHHHGVGVVAVMHDLNLALRYADDALVLSPSHPPVFGAVRAVLTPALVSQHWGVHCEQVDASGVPQLLFSA